MIRFLLAAILTLPSIASAHTYPDRPIRLIVPFPPGGTTDIVARIVSDRLGQRLGQAVIVENKPGGAGGAVGTLEIARAKPDGYTLGMSTVGTLGTSPAANPKMGYDPLKDFSFVTNIAANPMVIAVGPKVKEASLKDLIAKAQKSPDAFTYGSSGTGGVAHLMGELFKVTTNTKLVHVPYRGASPALNDVVAGQVDMVFDSLVSTDPFSKTGRLRLVAVSGEKRATGYADVPTFRELGLERVDSEVWYGLIGPAGIPKEILDKISDEVKAVLAMPDVLKHLEQQGAKPAAEGSDAFRKQAETEVAKWKQVVETQNIRMD